MKRAVLNQKRQLTDDVIELWFEVEEEFSFVPGQFVSLRIEDRMPPCIRAYSVAKVAADKRSFALCIKVVDGGRGSNWLNGLAVGDGVNFIGPNGNFVYHERGRDLLFVATGTGVAPFLAMIEALLGAGFQRKITLIFGVRNEEDLFYVEEFSVLMAEFGNFEFITTLSRASDGWNGLRGRVTDFLTARKFENCDAYICGLNAMIVDVERILLEQQNFPREAVEFERYD